MRMRSKVFFRVPIKEQFDKTRLRPRKEMKTEIDQAHFLIGAALPGSGVNIEEELSRNTWAVRRSARLCCNGTPRPPWSRRSKARPR